MAVDSGSSNQPIQYFMPVDVDGNFVDPTGVSAVPLTRNLWVDGAAAPAGDGSLTTPYDTIQAALDAIQDSTGKPTVADVKSGAWVPANLGGYTTESPPVVWNVRVVNGAYPEDLWIGPGRDINMIALGTVVVGSGDLIDYGSTDANSVVWHTANEYNRNPGTRAHLRFTSITAGEVSSTQPAADTGWMISGDIVVVQTVASDHNADFYFENSKVFGDIDSTRKSTLPFNVYLKRFMVGGDVNIPNLGALQLAESGEIDGAITADYYGMLRFVEFTGDMSFQNFNGSLQPSGFYSCYFKTAAIQFIRRETAGSAGVAADMVLDPASNYWFSQAGGLLTEEDTGGGGRGVPVKVELHAMEALRLNETTTPTAATGVGRVYTKTDNLAYFQDGAGFEQELVLSQYAEMYFHENVTVSTISTTLIPHFVDGIFGTGALRKWTFQAGSNGTITAFADAGGGQVTVTDATHGLSNGDIVSIAGTTSYNGVFAVANVTGTTFDITDTWVADDATGVWSQGDALIAAADAAGMYNIGFSGFGSSAGANKIFEFEIYINEVAQHNVEASRKFVSAGDRGSFSGGGVLTIATGDIVSLALINNTDATDFTLTHANIRITRL